MKIKTVRDSLNFMKMQNWLAKKNVLPFLVFLVPLLLRAVPEILMGPFIVGFDTLGFYVPNVVLWLHSGVNLWSFLVSAPLFYTILFSIVDAGGPLIVVLKIIPPLLLGFLGLSIYIYARKGLNWSPNKSALPALLGTLYFVALRVSWDMLRNELALVFFFTVLTLLNVRQHSSWKRYLVLSFAILAVVLSNQIGAIIMLGVVLFAVIAKLLRKEYIQGVNLIIVSLPGVLFFVLVSLNGLVQAGILSYSADVMSPLASWTGFTSYPSMLISEAGFFLYCYLPLLPLVLIGLRRFGNLQLRSWLLVCLILLFFPISVSPYRWVLMLMYPLAFYATDALSRLKSIKWKRLKFTAHRIAILYLVLSTAILSFGFIFMTSEVPFFYFNSNYFNNYVSQIPSSMLQNTISITDCRDTSNALQWFRGNVNSSALLLTHTVFYGWALLMVNNTQVTNYGFGDPAKAATVASQKGYSQIYLIWWINGQGWYGQPTIPSSFHEVYQSGEIAIYNYAPNY